MQKIKLVVTDLDGTLLSTCGKVSETDQKTLVELGSKEVVRAIATGRSPYSFEKVIPNDFPIDYLIFSSGAGTMNWKTKEILYTTELIPIEIQEITRKLITNSVDFMVHEPIPANHRFLFHATGNDNPDFYRRIEIYKNYCQPFIPGVPYDTCATQVLAVLPSCVNRYENLRVLFSEQKVIRATSPLDGKSIWMEIFRKDVSKAYGINWLCNALKIGKAEVLTIGNDFNDLDMLQGFENSYVVANAPNELKNQFKAVKSNNESGFSDAVKKLINL
jgi:HAD superfamily hydrolase (TIGR01484 family)